MEKRTIIGIDPGTNILGFGAIISPDGERTFATHLGAAILLSDSHLSLDLFKGWDYCYVEGYLIANRPLFKKAIELAKQAGCKVVFRTFSQSRT